MLANPGDILLGKYRVEDVIGVGGMGRVVRASHLYLQQPVAIKILLPQMAESKTTVERFLREAQATVKLRNEHIARVMDVGTGPDGVPFMVMEFLEGFDLNQILRHHGPQMAQPVVDLILQACEGISEAHAIGIIHRDIKPSNFFITRRPDGSNLLKILDFGISKTPAELSDLTGTQTVVGTPTYMAPEQMRTARATDARSDIWSMGVVMYQMLVGRPPFEAETYAELVLKVGVDPPNAMYGVQLPQGLETIVMRCLEKNPADRIQNVGDLARMLAPYASDPMSAQQSAERATRILTQPKGGMSLSSMSVGSGGIGSGGMGLTPPPNLTPKSWSHTGGSSVGGAAGQIGISGNTHGTKITTGNRSIMIAVVAVLCIAAGAGGFMLASSGKGSAPATTTPAAPVVVAPTPPPPVAVAPTPPPPVAVAPTPVVPPPAVAAGSAAVSTSSAKAGLDTQPTPPPPEPVAVVVKPKPVAAKPVAAKPVAKPPVTTKKPQATKNDDLFDDRR